MINYSEQNKNLYTTLTLKIYNLILSQYDNQNLPNDDFIKSILLIAIDLELFDSYYIHREYILKVLNNTYAYYSKLNESRAELARHLADSLFNSSEMIKRFSNAVNECYYDDSDDEDDWDFILANEYPPYLSEPHEHIIEKESQQETNINITSIQNEVELLFKNDTLFYQFEENEEDNSLEL